MLGIEALENGNLCLDWNGDVIKGWLTVWYDSLNSSRERGQLNTYRN